MYTYKRGMDDIKKAKNVEFVMSNNLDICLCSSAILDMKKPYNGLYIKNGKVILENLVEKFENKDDVCKICNINTISTNISSSEYLTSIDLRNNIFEYDTKTAYMKKRIYFEEGQELLIIDYNLKNKTNMKTIFKVIPLVTYRDLFCMKKENLLKFNQRSKAKSTLINLNISKDENIILQSDIMEYTEEYKYLYDVRHEYISKMLEKNIYVEDLVIPGEFEMVLKPEENLNIRLYISSKKYDIDMLNKINIQDNLNNKIKILTSNIPDEYIELKDLSYSISNLNMNGLLVPSLPYKKDYNQIVVSKDKEENIKLFIDDIKKMTNIVRSLEGQYIVFNKIDEARLALLKLIKYIKVMGELKIEDEDFKILLILLKLWCVETMNKLISKKQSLDLFLDFIKKVVDEILDEKFEEKYFKYIKIVALSFNALKIYENILINKKETNLKLYEKISEIPDFIVNNFWIEEKRILKRNLDDKDFEANIDMMYALSLSYPCVYQNSIPFKLLDTIFKELYTPYGLRISPKSSSKNKGLIYPRYMAHFVKANLRQNGVTRASQKIAYNLVRELLQDISKYENGGIKKVYHEKGIKVDNVGYDLLTNAEVIRLYEMLT